MSAPRRRVKERSAGAVVFAPGPSGIPVAAQRVLQGFEDDTDYRFRRGHTLVEKDVRFYLIESATRAIKLSHEHSDFAWLGYTPALARVSFEGPRRILQAAHAFVLELRS